MTTFTTQDRQDAQRDALLERVRVAIMSTAYWCADNADSESYNAVKVLCSDVLAMLQDAQRTPLTEEEIWKNIPMRRNDIFVETELQDFIEFARAIERAHGIGE